MSTFWKESYIWILTSRKQVELNRKSSTFHPMKNMPYLLFLTFIISVMIASCMGNPSESDTKPDTADDVARAIEKAIHKSDWDQTKWIHWVFPGPREHLYDKERNYAEVRWGDFRTLIDVDTQDGVVYKNGKAVMGQERDSLLNKAWSAFINDLFWLNAPAKLFDDGTKRTLVECGDKTCLKVEYTSGGVTPGDHYIWHYNDEYLPTAYEMYVSVISTPGVKSTWEGWITLASGARISTIHQTGKRTMEMKDVKSGTSYQDFGRAEDPFQVLKQE